MTDHDTNLMDFVAAAMRCRSHGETHTITLHGEPVAVMMPLDEYESMKAEVDRRSRTRAVTARLAVQAGVVSQEGH